MRRSNTCEQREISADGLLILLHSLQRLSDELQRLRETQKRRLLDQVACRSRVLNLRGQRVTRLGN